MHDGSVIRPLHRRARPRPVWLGCLAALLPAHLPASEDTGTLAVQVSGFAHDGGHAVAKLFAPGDDVLGPGRWTATGSISTGQAQLRWTGLAHGRYAMVIFHDQNGNGRIDHNLLGLPAEPLGFSNGFRLSWRSGMPSFEKLQFEFTPPQQTLEVAVQ